MKESRSYKYAHIFPLLLQTLVWPLTWVLLKTCIRFDVRGKEHLRGLKKPVIFAVNHTNEWDPILTTAALRPLSPLLPMFYTARERAFYGDKGWLNIIYHPLFFRAWGAYPVFPGLQNYEESLRHHIGLIEQKRGSICFFPEGRITKNSDGSPMEPKGGVAFLLDRTQAPIVPVAITGAHRMTAKEFFLRKREVLITFGAPIYPSDIFTTPIQHPDEYIEHARTVMEKVQHASLNNKQ